jgi:heme oxygenase
MSLKEITKDLHTAAEKTKFAKLLLNGNISRDEYANYLYQMLAIYDPIEFLAEEQGLLANLPGIKRISKIYQDYLELKDNKLFTLSKETLAYHMYLLELGNDPERRHLIKAHMYVRHMGDLFGGQYIAKAVPGEGRFYQFDDVEGLKTAIRAELTDDLGDEARVAFEWAIKIMKELGGE